MLELKGRFTAQGKSDIAATLAEASAGVAQTASPPPGMHHIMRHYVTNLLRTSIGAGRITSEAYFAVSW